MTIARVPFQPICLPTDDRVPVNNNIGPITGVWTNFCAGGAKTRPKKVRAVRA